MAYAQRRFLDVERVVFRKFATGGVSIRVSEATSASASVANATVFVFSARQALCIRAGKVGVIDRSDPRRIHDGFETIERSRSRFDNAKV